jgi:hypothetical protein
MMETKNLRWFVLIIVSAIFTRLLLLKEAIHDDEAVWTSLTSAPNYLWLNSAGNPHPLLAQWCYNFGAFLFGQHTLVFRSVTLCFAIATIFVTYLLAKELYDENVALISIFLMSISMYHLIASLRITIGIIIVLFYLLTIYSFVKYEATGKRKWLMLTGIFFGLALLTKYSAIYILAILAAYTLLTTDSFVKSIYRTLKIFLIGLCVYAIFPVLIWISGKLEMFPAMVAHTSTYAHVGLHWVAPIMLLLWATPLLILLPLLSVLRRDRKDLLLVIWIAAIFAINFIIIGRADVGPWYFLVGRGDYVRYFMNIIPPLSILGACAIVRFNLRKKSLTIIAGVAVFFSTILYVINSFPQQYIPQDFAAYTSYLLQGKLSFFFPYTTSSGALFGTSALGIALVWIVSISLFVWILATRTTKTRKFLFIILLGVMIGFNAFLAQEYVFHTQHVNPSDATYFAVDYFNDNNLDWPLSTNAEGVYFYLIPEYISHTDTQIEDGVGMYLGRFLERDGWYEYLRDVGGTAMVLNHPALPKERLVFPPNCNLVEKYVDSGQDLLIIYSC